MHLRFLFIVIVIGLLVFTMVLDIAVADTQPFQKEKEIKRLDRELIKHESGKYLMTF